MKSAMLQCNYMIDRLNVQLLILPVQQEIYREEGRKVTNYVLCTAYHLSRMVLADNKIQVMVQVTY